MAVAIPKKGITAVQINANSQPLTKAITNPPKNIDIVCTQVVTFSPMAPPIAWVS